MRSRVLASLIGPLVLILAGCAGGGITPNPSNSSFSISPGTISVDTNCTGCNATSAQGKPVEKFTATLPNGSPASVTWSVSGGDSNSGPGTITTDGLYTPPPYLTADHSSTLVKATLDATTTATALLTVTPGFLQPLTPENVTLGANGQVTITGYLAEAGGNDGINFAVSSSSSGSSGGQGALGSTNCQRSSQAFTICSVPYTAPNSVPTTGPTYIVATVENSPSKDTAEILLNSQGVSSNPISHQAQLQTPISLGSSGGNNNDYDTQGNQIVDCCSGTLGSLIQDSNNRQYLLSNNHVLARSDHASVGDAIIQPGLIDNNCTPNGDGPGTTPVGTLTGWLALDSNSTNADAAIAQVNSSSVNPSGSILELGARQSDGTLAAAPPGTSSTSGKGENASLNMTVAKSGRTTGLTCASVSAMNLDVRVDYYLDCAETKPYLTKTYTNQLAISGNQFIDAGDSGSLIVDTSNAEPVGLFFAGGSDASGVSQGVANPAPDVLSELGAQVGGGATYSFVGAADHAVSCLNYGDSTVAEAQTRKLPQPEIERGQRALQQARLLVNPNSGILGVDTSKSNDHPGEAAVAIYVDQSMSVNVPATVDGVRTVVIPTDARELVFGLTTPMALGINFNVQPVPAALLNQAALIKQQVAHNLLQQNPAFFGVGVGRSLDSTGEPALVIYVDRKNLPSELPPTMNGLRTRYVIMDRLHVTRSYATNIQPKTHCMAPAAQHSSHDSVSIDHGRLDLR